MTPLHADKLGMIDWLDDALVTLLVLVAIESDDGFVELGVFSRDCDESGAN